MYSFILILLCIINVKPTESSLHIPQYPVHSTFDCAVNIINSATDISVLIAHFHEENINHLLTKLRPNLTIFNIRKHETANYKLDLYKYAMYLIIIRVVEELNIVFKVLNLYPGGKIIVLNLGNNEEKEIFQIAWTKYIINICIIHVSNGSCYIDTYFPYENSDCGKNISVTRLGRYQDLSLDAMFPNKVPLVLPGCEIRVVANIAMPFVMDATLPVEDSRKIGMEAVMLKNILGRINLTQKLIASTNSTLSFIFSNGTVVGTHSYLAEGKCDLVYGQKWNAYFFADYFDNTHSHHIESSKWHVPLALPGQQWTNILLAFDYPLWLSVLIMLFCMILVTWLFGFISTQTGRYSSLGLCSLKIWYMLLMGSVQLPTVASLRILLYFWTIFALLLTTSYQSQLLGFLMKPVYEHQISTLEELLNSSLKIPLESNFILSLEKSGSPSDLAILKKGYVVTMEEIRNIWLDFPKDTALLGPTTLSNFVLWLLQYYSDGKPVMYVFKPTFNSFKLTMHTVKGFPLVERMGDIILRSMAAGFNAKWQRDLEPYRTPEKNELRVLTTEDVTGVYIILALGCLIAILSFIIEILMGKIKIKVCI